MNASGVLSLGGSFDSNLADGGYAATSFFFPGNLNQNDFAERSLRGSLVHHPDVVEFEFEKLAQSKESRYHPQIFLSGSLTEQSDMVESVFEKLARSKESRYHPHIFLIRKPAERSEEVLKRWEGVVETVDEDDGVFTARLYDLETDESYPSDMAELLIDDISDDDRSLLQAGAVFYLTVGYSERASGRKDRFVRLEFRRLPNWTESDLRRAGERAQRITRFLDSEN